MIQRFEQRFHVPIVAFHSKLSEQERLQSWLSARDGTIPIIIGTRSAVWTPLARPGVIIVDEEHDLSYKQQDHFRYSARDVAVVRAQRAKIPVILGSATPSLDSLFNAQQQRYHHLILPERAGAAVHPSFQIIDMRRQPDKNPLSQTLKTAIQQCLERRQQVLLFINRRGYAPTLMCYECDWVATCQNCDAKMTFHGNTQKLLCHHCGASRVIDPKCPKCGHPRLYLLGQGTERVEERLVEAFPTARILRIDSDSTRSKRAMHMVLDKVHKGEVDILVGTQMLAKGHHFPKVTLVGVVNIDGGLQGVDFRSTERVAQLVMQVAGRAGRADDPGMVLIQTYHPQHPLLLRLISQGYHEFAQAALLEREEAEFPPFSKLALLRVEAMDREAAMQFLNEAKQRAQRLNSEQKVSLWGTLATCRWNAAPINIVRNCCYSPPNVTHCIGY
ncbi:MAG: primosomal protein N' [Thiotrichaceae bacterium]